MEAEERERARLEAERQARLEEERRVAEEKRRIAEAKSNIRGELGEAVGMDVEKFDKQKVIDDTQRIYGTVTGDEIEDAAAAMEEIRAEREAEADQVDQEKAEEVAERFENSEDAIHTDDAKTLIDAVYSKEKVVDQEMVDAVAEVMSGYERNNDPRKIAAKVKLNRQKREAERREQERALKLRKDRDYYVNKPYDVIRKEYSKAPIHVMSRGFMNFLFKAFEYIPPDTDNPDLKRILLQRELDAEKRKREMEERNKMEFLYRKYSTDTKYQIRRDIADIKWKRKKKLEAKNKPKPVYTPPKRTEEEQAEIDRYMKHLYKEYRVSLIEQIRRWIKSMSKEEKERQLNLALGKTNGNHK